MLQLKQSSSKFIPMYLFQTDIENKPTYFFISHSYEKLWVKQAPNDWEEINVSSSKSDRGGEATYSLSENKYRITKLCTGSRGQNQPYFINLPYIEGKTSLGNYTNQDLDEILMSKQKLKDLGIINHLELDLTYIDEKTTQEQETAHNQRLEALKEKERTQYYKKKNDSDWFDDMLAKSKKFNRAHGSKVQSKSRLRDHASIFCEPSTSSSESEQDSSKKLTEKVSQLTL